MLKGIILISACFISFYGCSSRRLIQPPPPIHNEAFPYDIHEYLSGISADESRSEEVEEKEVHEIIAVKEGSQEEQREHREKEEERKAEEAVSLVSIFKPTESSQEPLKLPDLIVSDLSLKKRRHLVATLTNIGTAPFPMEKGELCLSAGGQTEERYLLKALSDRTLLLPQETITLLLPFRVIGRREVEARVDVSHDLEEVDRENNRFKKMIEGLPLGPDITIQEFHLTEDLDLHIFVINVGELDLRKGTTFRIRIYLNDRKVSDFEHFTSEELKAQSKKVYILSPPYRVTLKGSLRVKVSLTPGLRTDDIFLENNTIERRFIIFPFQLGGQAREQFSFLVSPRPSRGEEPSERIKMELRWERAATPLKLSFRTSGEERNLPDLMGRSPLRVEWPIPPSDSQRESHWMVAVTNSFDHLVEGHLIVQHP